jgi:hypothetical protein
VHLRRALLLFAIVLGLAAVAASVSRPRDDSGERTAPADEIAADEEDGGAPTLAPGTSRNSSAVELTFDPAEVRTLELESDRAATVLVGVEAPGQVEIPGLGLSEPATPLTPARFELFAPDPGRYEISFTAAEGNEERRVGTLAVEDPME